MISLHTIRSQWYRPVWAVLLVVCVLLKSFTVTVAAAAHETDHGNVGSGYSVVGDSTASDDPSEDSSDDGDPFHRLLHANHCCLQDGMAVFFSDKAVWIAYPHSPPAMAPWGRMPPLEGLLLRPPRLA